MKLGFEQVAKRLDQGFAAATTAYDHRERCLIAKGRGEQHAQVTADTERALAALAARREAVGA